MALKDLTHDEESTHEKSALGRRPDFYSEAVCVLDLSLDVTHSHGHTCLTVTGKSLTTKTKT